MSQQADRFAALLHEQHQLVTMYDGSSTRRPPPGLEGLEPIDELDEGGDLRKWLDPKDVLSAAGIAAMCNRDAPAPDTAPSAGPPRNNGWVVYTQEEVATHTLKVSQWVGWKHWEDRQQPHQHEHHQQQQQQQQHRHHYTEAASPAMSCSCEIPAVSLLTSWITSKPSTY